jgi:hypothetical protein
MFGEGRRKKMDELVEAIEDANTIRRLVMKACQSKNREVQMVVYAAVIEARQVLSETEAVQEKDK